MIRSDYANKILFILNFKALPGYQLSKYLSRRGKKISNGTLIPTLNVLLKKEFITFTQVKNKKIYQLTDKGKNYVTLLKEIGKQVTKDYLSLFFDENLMYMDLLSNIEEMDIIKRVVETFAEEIFSIFKCAFKLEKAGKHQTVQEMKHKINMIIKEVQ